MCLRTYNRTTRVPLISSDTVLGHNNLIPKTGDPPLASITISQKILIGHQNGLETKTPSFFDSFPSHRRSQCNLSICLATDSVTAGTWRLTKSSLEAKVISYVQKRRYMPILKLITAFCLSETDYIRYANLVGMLISLHYVKENILKFYYTRDRVQ